MTSLSSAAGAPHRPSPVTTSGLRLIAAGPRLWRALDRSGRIIGHIRQWQDPAGARFRALRYSSISQAFRDLGDFWSMDDALTCLFYAR
jgi:hypothetical protein